eukprot:466835-Amphidinium_carterae.1
MLSADEVPYVDMALWGPFQNRLQKRLILTGLQLGIDGVLRRVELKGPASFEHWIAGYKLLKTALISFNAVSPARLERYADFINQFILRYGASHWSVIYTAESRMR